MSHDDQIQHDDQARNDSAKQNERPAMNAAAGPPLAGPNAELAPKALHSRELSRRKLLIGAAGLQLGLYASKLDPGRYFLKKLGVGPASGTALAAEGSTISSYLTVDTQGIATITIPKPDIGQGLRTSLAMLFAEELEVDWADVRVEQAPADSAYGNQGVGGSGSIRSLWNPMRQAGAAARTMFVEAAAERWGVDASECRAEGGRVLHSDGQRSLGYGELAEAAGQRSVPDPDSMELKPSAQFKIIGQDHGRVDNTDVVRGRAKYGADVRLPGMKFAVIARPPAFGARFEDYDADAALAVPGVVELVPNVSGGIAVVADNTWAAIEGRYALNVQWDRGANADVDSATIRADLVEAAGELPAPQGVAVDVQASFSLQYLAHATMEPMNCTVAMTEDGCEVWAPTQNPSSTQRGVASAAGMAQDSVMVNVTLSGGGFGRRAFTDYAGEAARIAVAVNAPVQLIWTRDDDMQNDYYRPASQHVLRGGLDAEGKPVAWAHRMAIANRRGGFELVQQDEPELAEIYRMQQRSSSPYSIPGFGVDQAPISQPVPTGVWRSVNHGNITFANECFVDMLAHAGGQDPLDFRVENSSESRFANALRVAAQAYGWGKELPQGHGAGVAGFWGYGGYVAHVVEVSVSTAGEVRVVKVVAAVDPGLAINPSSVRAQIEGCIADGVATSLYSEITIDRGGVVQSGWGDLGWLRIDRMPEIEVVIIDDQSSSVAGMGELGFPSISPAICNAVFAATGKRVERLPIRAEDLEGWAGQIDPEPTATPVQPAPTDTPEPTGPRNEIFMPSLQNGNDNG